MKAFKIVLLMAAIAVGFSSCIVPVPAGGPGYRGGPAYRGGPRHYGGGPRYHRGGGYHRHYDRSPHRYR